MKKILILLTALLLTSVGLMAQSVPAGMRYQALARGLDGSLLKEKTLIVQVELFSAAVNETVYYTETHEVRSSDLGLLDFIIGEGSKASGKFSEIPWVSDEMWVRISVKLQGDDQFQIISSGQLYSVPYALYAATAGELQHSERTPGIGMNSINWTLAGNYNSQNWNNGNPVLGTTDNRNFVFATNNIPRLIIDKNGTINFLVDVDYNADMNVDGTTTLNGDLTVTNLAATHLTGTLVVDKATTLNDVLVVENMASTQLTGSLDVDQTMNVDGATTLNSSLSVTGMSATSLSGTMTVAQPTTLNDDLTVANNAPTHLTGDLDVDGDILAGTMTVGGALIVEGMSPTHLTGTLEVDKLATLESGLQVNSGGAVGPGTSYVAYFDNAEGGSSDGIAVQLHPEELSKDNNFMTFYRGSTVAGRIEGYRVGDMDEIPAPTSDEIWTAVCIAVADYNPLTILWTQMAGGFNLIAEGWNATTIPTFDIPDIPAFTITDVPALTIPDVPAFVIPDVPGFTIPDIPGVVIPDVPEVEIGPYLCAEVCFCPCEDLSWDCCCAEVCLVPEMTLFPGITLPDFPGIAIPDFPGIPIPDFPGIPIPDFPGIAIPDFPGLVIPAVPELDLSSAFGTCPTLPTLSDILVSEGVCPNADLFDLETGYFSRLAKWAFEHRLHNLVSLDPVMLLGNALAWGLTTAVLNDGVVYGSKGADYAEYLPKLYPTEVFLKGEVIGVYNGKISKNTANADQILVITSQPMVLGNMPAEGEDVTNSEKVAFLGQVPVYVSGRVHVGDYIIPSGKNDGVAKAIPAGSLTAEMLSMVLGQAWSDHAGEGISMINASIGLRATEISEVLKKQSIQEDAMYQQVQVQREGAELLSNDIDQIKRALGLTTGIYNP